MARFAAGKRVIKRADRLDKKLFGSGRKKRVEKLSEAGLIGGSKVKIKW